VPRQSWLRLEAATLSPEQTQIYLFYVTRPRSEGFGLLLEADYMEISEYWRHEIEVGNVLMRRLR